MRYSPSIVPEDSERGVYLVLEDFGPLGRAWRETDDGETDRATVIRDLLDGQYENPVRIVAFNTAEGWSRDVTEDIASDLQDFKMSGQTKARYPLLSKSSYKSTPLKKWLGS